MGGLIVVGIRTLSADRPLARCAAGNGRDQIQPLARPKGRAFHIRKPGRLFSSRAGPASGGGYLLDPSKLRSIGSTLPSGASRLTDVGGIKVVQFGPGVELLPVAVASIEEFSAATAQATSMFRLKAVITGPQFSPVQGSQGLQGQVLVNGKRFGNSAQDFHYVATVAGPNGRFRLSFGKGDPPLDVITGFGGAVPLLIEGRAVGGYNKAWQPYLESTGTGQNILAYNSETNTAALFIQPDGRSGHSLRTVRGYIKAVGYDYASLFDGSGSTSLRYRGRIIVKPELKRELFIPLGIGFR